MLPTLHCRCGCVYEVMCMTCLAVHGAAWRVASADAAPPEATVALTWPCADGRRCHGESP